ncbi:predicted protein [Uncinocarpus reesii 1704]|uniref:Uncharacterized protein n=1 Tax=Uncinocarpus reesii (strain UAMH 1704) TaxID=336963 RepID=C4JZ13_UNCRE|nr:uncharacterized protein UREG_07414 [Uncinocarpus reesii 1704]EEP82549.1 predicted protein [Uncinocarpus reesii 1704]
MKITGTQAFKYLTSKIHPPLPRTPRESEQLLSILTSSFRRQLDREHPPVQSEEPQTVSKPVRSINADQHLSSILNHPLFSTIPQQPRTRQQDAQSQAPVEDPILVLDRAIASGIADASTVHECLRLHRLQLDGMPRETRRARMSESNVDRLILSWLSSTDQLSRRDFFRNREIVQSVMPYMVNARHQPTVMKWLDEIRREVPCTPNFKKVFTHSPQYIVLESYISAECSWGEGIVAALRFLMEACGAPVRGDYSHLPPYILSIASRLARRICSLPASQIKSIPVQLFDDFSEIFQDVGEPAIQVRRYFWKAKLGLYRPIDPNPSFAIKHAEIFSQARIPPDRHSSALLQLYLEAAQLCIKQDKHAQASRLISVAKKLLPDGESAVAAQPKNDKEKQDFLPLVNAIENGLLPTLG